MNAVPVTVLTGFLGSGKTTLINRLLSARPDVKFAIIENEYGEVGIDAEILHRDRTETIIELSNGCICCTVRGDLARALGDLATRLDSGEIAFDHIVIETTGLADPGPLVRTFMAETKLLERYYLDGVVTLVDALNGARTIAQSSTARSQLAYADRLLITKPDQSDTEAIASLTKRLAAINATAEVHTVDLLNASSDARVADLLGIRGYLRDRVKLPEAVIHDHVHHGHGHDHDHDHDHTHDHHDHEPHHDPVVSITFRSMVELNSAAFDLALTAIEQRYGQTLWRMKGIVALAGLRQRLLIQGVQGLTHKTMGTIWRPYEPRRSTLVLIGEDLDRDWILRQLEGCEPAGTPRTTAQVQPEAR